jgi:hypothetical protein
MPDTYLKCTECGRESTTESDQAKRLPPADLRVDFGERCTGSSNPMPPEVRAAYEDRILASKAQSDGGRLAGTLFVGSALAFDEEDSKWLR